MHCWRRIIGFGWCGALSKGSILGQCARPSSRWMDDRVIHRRIREFYWRFGCMPRLRALAARAKLLVYVKSTSRFNGCVVASALMPRRWLIFGLITARFLSAYWSTASRRSCDLALRAWIVLPRMECECAPRREHLRFAGIRRWRNADAKLRTR